LCCVFIDSGVGALLSWLENDKFCKHM
jgi:hypothetical protein